MNEAVERMKGDVKNLLSSAESAGRPGDGDPNPEDANLDAGTGAAGVRSNGADDGDGSGVDHGNGDTPELSERDQLELDKALASGWKPPENWEGAEEDFVRPREWNRTVALYKRMDRKDEEIRGLRDQLGDFEQRIKNVMEVTKAKTLAEIEIQRKEAVDESDHERLEYLDKQKKEVEEKYDMPERDPQPQALRPEVEDWMSDNPWFEKDQEMTDFAITIQTRQLQRLPDPANPTSQELENALEKTTAAIKRAYPEKFERQPRARANPLERPARHGKARELTVKDLTEEEQKVLGEIKRLGGMSEKDYLQAIQDMRINESSKR